MSKQPDPKTGDISQETDNPEVNRDSLGRVTKGSRLNPHGRPKLTLEQKEEARLQREEDRAFADRVEYLLGEGKDIPLEDIPAPEPPPEPEQGNRDPKTGHFIGGNTASVGNLSNTPKEVSPSDIRKRIGGRIGSVINVLFKQAESGDTAASKLLLDRYLPSLKAVEHRGIDVSSLPRMIIANDALPHDPVQDEADNIEDAELVGPDGKPLMAEQG